MNAMNVNIKNVGTPNELGMSVGSGKLGWEWGVGGTDGDSEAERVG